MLRTFRSTQVMQLRNQGFPYGFHTDFGRSKILVSIVHHFGSRLLLSLLLLASLVIDGCVPAPAPQAAPPAPAPQAAPPAPVATAVMVSPFMTMDPPPDSDKNPLPPSLTDLSCWEHTAANMLAAAGYGTGTTVQDRADDIFADMSAQFGTANPGWPDAALQWWLASSNNTWTNDIDYTLVTVVGTKTMNPWANSNGARQLANDLRVFNQVGVIISWPTDAKDSQGNEVVGTGAHAITAWGDDVLDQNPLTNDPGGIRVTDSDRDIDGEDVEAYNYDAYTNPNPGGANEGNGWYFDYSATHPYIRNIVILSKSSTGVNTSVRVKGSYKIQQTLEQAASDLHYSVGTDADILTYRHWLDVEGIPTVTEAQPRRELTVDWDLPATVPQGTWVTISTEFVLPIENAIYYRDMYFTYPDGTGSQLPDLGWTMETPLIGDAESRPNVTGGYVIGAFDVYDDALGQPIGDYRLVHQYLYNQSPESHTFSIRGTKGYTVKNLRFDHSYGYPTTAELWDPAKTWMTTIDGEFLLNEEPTPITIDWQGQLPYPEGVGPYPEIGQ